MSQSPAKPPAETLTVPVPPRFWWLKRLVVAGAVYLLFLLGVRLWWGHAAETRLETLLARFRARGEPVALSDFIGPQIADRDNAATYLSQAAAALSRPASQQLDLTQLDRRSCAENLAALQSQFAAQGQVFDLIRAARDKPDVDWGVKITSPAMNILLPFLAPQRHLTRFLGGAALVHHLSGDDAAAIENLHDILRIGAGIDAAQPPFLISHLVAIAIYAYASARIEDFTPGLYVTGGAVPPPPNITAAPRAEVQAVIAALLDDRLCADGWRRAMQSERAFQYDTVQVIVNRTASGPGLTSIGSGLGLSAVTLTPLRWAISPAWELDGVRLLGTCTRMLQAGSAADWPTAQAQWPPPEYSEGPIRALNTMMSRSLLPALDRALITHYRAIAGRRLAALGLAMRLYEVDHGHRPETLQALVPAYIPAIPSDPFDRAGAPLRYAPEAPTPVLYSVGLDGVDDHGAFTLRAGGDVDPETKDLPFFLNGDRPLPPTPPNFVATSIPTSTQAVPDDQQPIDAERQEQQEQPQQ